VLDAVVLVTGRHPACKSSAPVVPSRPNKFTLGRPGLTWRTAEKIVQLNEIKSIGAAAAAEADLLSI